MSDLVTYHKVNPDPSRSGCLNSGAEGDGVVFNGIEVLEGAFCFVGRENIIDAVAALYGMKQMRAKQLLGGDKKMRDTVEELQAKVLELEGKLEDYKQIDQMIEKAANARSPK